MLVHGANSGIPEADTRGRVRDAYSRWLPSSSSSPYRVGSDDDGNNSVRGVVRLADITPPTSPRRWTVAGLIPERFPSIVYADGGSAKSMLVLHMLECISRGLPWMGRETIKTKTPLYGL